MNNVHVEYAFKCRTPIDLHPYFDDINEEIDKLCNLTFSVDEVYYLVNNIDTRFGFLYEFVNNKFLNRKPIVVAKVDKGNSPFASRMRGGRAFFLRCMFSQLSTKYIVAK